MLTQQHPDLAFAILTSPPVVSGRQQMTLAATNYLTAAGAPDAVKQLIPRITSLGTQRMGLAYADFDAAKYRRSLTMPLLINYGVKDTAMPVEQGARLLIKAANQAGNTNVTLRYYDANHQLRTGSNQTVPGLPLEPHYTHDLEDWINAVTSGTGCERLGNADDRRNAAESDGHGTAEDPARAGEVDGCDCRRNRGLPALRAAGDVRRANSAHRRLGARAPCVTAGIARFGFDGTGGANGFDFNVFNGCDHTDRPVHTTECGTSNRNNRPSIPVGMRVALALNTLLAVGTTGVFLAYLVTVIIDAISLTDNSVVLAKNWHVIVMLTWLSLVAFAWLLVEIIVDACRRHARNRAIASIDDDADMNNGHDAAAGSRCDIGKDGKACIGSGHVIVATCVVVSAALSLALLAFWGLFC